MLKHTYTQLGVIARPRPHHPMAEAAVPGVGGDCNEQPREAPAARRDDVRVWRASVPVLEAPRTAVAVAVALVARIVDELGQRVVVARALLLHFAMGGGGRRRPVQRTSASLALGRHAAAPTTEQPLTPTPPTRTCACSARGSRPVRSTTHREDGQDRHHQSPHLATPLGERERLATTGPLTCARGKRTPSAAGGSGGLRGGAHKAITMVERQGEGDERVWAKSTLRSEGTPRKQWVDT